MQYVKAVLFAFYALMRRDARPKVIFYHDLCLKHTPMGTEEAVFWRQMRWLREGDVVCFDDGFRGIWEARERMRKMGLGVRNRVKVFVAPRLVGQNGYLTWDEMRVLQNDYGIDFQCHGWSHQTLVGPMIDESPIEERTEAWYVRELVESKEKISAELGKPVDELCFPVGYFNDELIARCKAAGYRRVYASYPGNVCDDYIQPRCLVQDLGVLAFRATLAGGMNVFRNRYLSAHRV